MNSVTDRGPSTFAAAGALSTTLIGVVGWVTLPDSDVDWFGLVLLAPLLWGFLEAVAFTRRRRSNAEEERRYLRYLVATVLFFAIMDAGPVLLVGIGWLGAGWIPKAAKAEGVASGLALAIWGNYLPKFISPWTSEDEPFDWYGVHRFGGWLATLAGLLVSWAWLIGPTDRTQVVTVGAVAVVFSLLLVRKIHSRVSYARRKRLAAE
ncbi:MAG: hypothetical protein WEG36_04830 [Gemmatimonadota bacterium]